VLNIICLHAYNPIGRLKWEEHKFEASQGYTARPCLKKKKAYVYKDLYIYIHYYSWYY
jgi:hypothetical protein